MRKTIEDLVASDKQFFTAADVSGVLGADPNKIRETAKQHPELLGFPVVRIGNRVKIPRKPFLHLFAEEKIGGQSCVS